MAAIHLSVDQKSLVALDIALVVYLTGIDVASLPSGGADAYTFASFAFTFVYVILAYFGLKAKAWAYVGSSVLSVILIGATAFSIPPGTSALWIWYATVSTILFSLIALEGSKGYLQSKEGRMY